MFGDFFGGSRGGSGPLPTREPQDSRGKLGEHSSVSSRRGLGRASLAVSLVLIAALFITPAGAHVTDSFNHLWEDHLKPIFGNAGTINDPGNPVHWTKLKNVPNGFADGTDGGVLASNLLGGYGINKRRSFNKYIFDADLSVHVATDSSTGLICNNGCVEGTLTLNPGRYIVWGKIKVHQQDFDEELLHVNCTLNRGGVQDLAGVRQVGDSSGNPGSTAYETLNMTIAPPELTASGNVTLSCEDQDVGDVNGFDLRITALRIG
jgi:hypothetical protein